MFIKNVSSPGIHSNVSLINSSRHVHNGYLPTMCERVRTKKKLKTMCWGPHQNRWPEKNEAHTRPRAHHTQKWCVLSAHEHTHTKSIINLIVTSSNFRGLAWFMYHIMSTLCTNRRPSNSVLVFVSATWWPMTETQNTKIVKYYNQSNEPTWSGLKKESDLNNEKTRSR